MRMPKIPQANEHSTGKEARLSRTYSVDEEGKLLTMYRYWEEPPAIESDTPLHGHHFYVE